MEWIFIFFGVIYAAIILYFFSGLFRISQTVQENRFSVSVMVPARNEAQHITECLASLWNQTYPSALYEVVVIDDNSTDNTGRVVEEFISDKPNFRLLRHQISGARPTYKKQALKFAIGETRGEIIMTIDADTVAQERWIQEIISQYDENTGLVAGLVSFPRHSEHSLFHRLQTLEFAGIVFCGVGSAGNNNPIICNGSNLSYRRQAFEDAGGYEGHLHLPSGDDDLLLQNIHSKTDWKIKYALFPESINFTRPAESLHSFLNQRSRWASKSLHYPSAWILPLLFSIYIFYLLVLAGLPLVLTGILSPAIFAVALLLKMIPEALVIFRALSILRRRDLLKLFLIAQFFQIPYILYVGFRGFFHKFSWKDSKSETS